MSCIFSVFRPVFASSPWNTKDHNVQFLQPACLQIYICKCFNVDIVNLELNWLKLPLLLQDSISMYSLRCLSLWCSLWSLSFVLGWEVIIRCKMFVLFFIHTFHKCKWINNELYILLKCLIWVWLWACGFEVSVWVCMLMAGSNTPLGKHLSTSIIVCKYIFPYYWVIIPFK